MRTRLVNAALMTGALLVAGLGAEPVLRLRYVEPVPPTPDAVLHVQPYLQTHPVFGFTWDPDISADENIVFEIADIEPEALSTDAFGVRNAPAAIAALESAGRADVVGLGDSFMEMAGAEFHDRFADAGLLYYSLAIHRQAPPQYAALFEAYVEELEPRAALVGVFENDFSETADFDAWRSSGLDWFAFHSGTWCGPPVPADAMERFARRHFRGYFGLARVIESRLRGERMSVRGPTEDQVDRVTQELLRLAAAARQVNVAVLVVFIPSRATARDETTAEAEAYDGVMAAVASRGARVLDLRPVFSEHPDPASLYYQEDAHWNRKGIALAGRTVLPAVEALLQEQPSEADTD